VNLTQLVELYKRYSSRGFEILGFPCNQFGSQAPGTDAEIKAFYKDKYGATFPMFHKDDVNYETTQEVYKYLRINSELYSEWWGTVGRIPWNYGKFLVNSEGKVVLWRAMTNPNDLIPDIEALLNA